MAAAAFRFPVAPAPAPQPAAPAPSPPPDLPGAYWARRRLALLQLTFALFDAGRPPRNPARNPNGEIWEADEIARLRKLRAAGASYSDCARALPGRTRNACITQCWRSGIRGATNTDNFGVVERSPLLARRIAEWSAPRDAPNDAIAIPSAGKTFLELGARDCRWPFGEGRHMRFCGAPQAPTSAYCPTHCGEAHDVAHDGVESARETA